MTSIVPLADPFNSIDFSHTDAYPDSSMYKFFIALSIFAAINVYVAMRIFARWPWAKAHVYSASITAVVFFALQLVGSFGNHLFFPSLKKQFDINLFITMINWSSFMALGLLSCLFFYVSVADLMGIVWSLTGASTGNFNADRRTLLTICGVTLGTLVVGVRQAVSGPLVRHVEIPLPNLPAGFDNLKIVQISDIHAGPIIGRKYVENVVRIANSLKPDLIALTGDFVDGTVGDLKDELSSLATLAAPLGTFYVTGNHEYYWGASEWTETFSTFGIRVLTNEHEIIRRNGDAIILAGVTDYSAYRMMPGEASDPGKALKGSPAGLTRILLAHQPASYKLAHKAGFDLQLSGHTHAGQYFPFCLFIGLFQRYYKGLNRFENMWVYVNSGTGYWGPPLRTGVPSEITQITLRKSSDVR